MTSRSHIVSVGLFSDPRESTVGKKISMDAAADDLGVNKRTIQRLIAIGELPAFKVGAKIVRVDTDDVASLLKPMHPNGHV